MKVPKFPGPYSVCVATEHTESLVSATMHRGFSLGPLASTPAVILAILWLLRWYYGIIAVYKY